MVSFNKVIFSKESVIDPFGRVFFYNNEVYRLINKDAECLCAELFSSGVLDELMNTGLIPKTFVEKNIVFEGGRVVLHHEKCSIIKPYEWSYEMYKTAAVHTLMVNKICNKYNYELKDGHPYNVTFHNGHPIFFDIGSIVKRKNNEWVAKKEFLETFIIPLFLWRDGDYFLLRTMLESPDFYYQRVQPYQSPLQVKYIRNKIKKLYYSIIKVKCFKWSTNKRTIVLLLSFLNRICSVFSKRKINIIKIIEDYRIPSMLEINEMDLKPFKTTWMDYHTNLNLDSIRLCYPRFERIFDIVNTYCNDAKTVLDLAANGGAFALLLDSKKKYQNITIGDYDENAINNGYIYFSKNNIHINTIWMNCMLPCEYDDVVTRIKSDIVFGLAITHHLILSQGFNLNFIFERFSSYTNKYLAIEFMPKGLWGGGEYPDIPGWYTTEWFKQTFEKYFNLLHYETLEVNRIIFVGEKIK